MTRTRDMASKQFLALATTLLCASVIYCAAATAPIPLTRRRGLHHELAESPVLFRPMPQGGGSFPPVSSSDAAAYCTPGDACWPSPAEWAALNVSVRGSLILPLAPEGSACSDPTSPQCAELQERWSDPYWRAAQPGAMQVPYWESNTTSGENCYTLGKPCAQGDVPVVAVAAKSADDVSAALKFASAHNIRVVIKSSGHEFQGRSTAANALLIWTTNMKGMVVSREFQACPGDTPIPVVSTQPGNGYGEAYALVDPEFALVGGSARTVSSAGGHLLGGGHSFMSPHYGLTADNVVELGAVLANGTIVTASACSHPDLFWALRGGGGGSFAVLTSATHRLHPQPNVLMGAFLEVALLQGLTSVVDFLDALHYVTPSLLNASARPGGGVFGGYFQVAPVSGSVYVFTAEWIYNGTEAEATVALRDIAAYVASDPTNFLMVNASLTPYPSFESWHSSFDPAGSGDRTGASTTIGCRFVPMLASDALRLNISIALAEVAQYTTLLGHLVLGGAVSVADPFGTLTSVGPAWRSGAWHMCLGAGWELNATVAEQQSTFSAVTQLTGLWRAAFPDSGAYWGESDFLEPQWQESFWGAKNYARLQNIKAVYDPTGVFTCWHCVELPAAAAAAGAKAAGAEAGAHD